MAILFKLSPENSNAGNTHWPSAREERVPHTSEIVVARPIGHRAFRRLPAPAATVYIERPLPIQKLLGSEARRGP
jgi:hypothetical protein